MRVETLKEHMARAEAAGNDRMILTTMRVRVPRSRIALARGLSARVVGTEKLESGVYRVIFCLAVSDVKRWISRITASPRRDSTDLNSEGE